MTLRWLAWVAAVSCLPPRHDLTGKTCSADAECGDLRCIGGFCAAAGGSGGGSAGGGAAGAGGGASGGGVVDEDGGFPIVHATGPITVDGQLTEYAASPAIVFGPPETQAQATVHVVWDETALYFAYDVADTGLFANNLEPDGDVYNDDAVEWFVDTANLGAERMGPESFQGILNVAGVRYDAQGTTDAGADKDINFPWQSVLRVQGTVDGGAVDTGYRVEVAVPWTTLGVAPDAGLLLRLGIALDDWDGGFKTVKHVMWPHVTTVFQAPENWRPARLAR